MAKQDTGKLSQKTKYLITKRQFMTISTPADINELAELSKLISKRRTAERRVQSQAPLRTELHRGWLLLWWRMLADGHPYADVEELHGSRCAQVPAGPSSRQKAMWKQELSPGGRSAWRIPAASDTLWTARA